MTTDPAEIPKIIKLAEGFYVRQEIDNIAWIDLGGYAVVVDALEVKETEKEVFEAISDTIGTTPVKYLFNTHTHYDHVVLNEAFKQRYGTEIIYQDGSIPAEGKWFEGSKRKCLFLPLPGCHTQEDCIVWFPNEKVLFTGDIFGWGLIPLTRSLRKDTSQLLIDTYNRMIDFGAEAIVPGHGPLISNSELLRWVEYFGWLKNQVSKLCNAPMPLACGLPYAPSG